MTTSSSQLTSKKFTSKKLTPVKFYSFLVCLLLGVPFVLILSSCAVKKRIDPVSNTYLKGIDTSQKIENLPFQHSWVKPTPNEKAGKYTSVYIKPIRTDLLPKSDWKKSYSSVIGTEADYMNEAKLIASHFREQLSTHLQDHPKRRFPITARANAQSLIVDIALTELEFSHPAARAAALAVPMPGSGAVVSAVSDPHVAFAMRIYDGASGQLLATAADRKFAPARIVDLNKLTVTSSPREIVQNWSTELSDSIQLGQFAEVEERGVFKILPW